MYNTLQKCYEKPCFRYKNVTLIYWLAVNYCIMDKDVLVTRVLEASAEGFKKLEGVSKTRFSYANLQKVVQER